jgi:hypothetical protein
MNIYFEAAYLLYNVDNDYIGDYSPNIIDEYEAWLKEHNIPFEWDNGPFYINVDDKYAEDILAFKLKFGL